MRTLMVSALLAAGLLIPACATYRDDLNRAERHFQARDYEKSLALFRVLEADFDSLSEQDKARYAYLRGMNDYQLANRPQQAGQHLDKRFRANARHWLALAQAIEQERPGSLQTDWKAKLQEALDDLNQDVYGVGVKAPSSSDKGQDSHVDQDQAGDSDAAKQDTESAGESSP